MFKGNNNLVVGLFVSIAIAFFVGFILWLTGRSGAEEMERYSLLFEKDVSGLAVGGPVKYMGVNIGSVIQMEIVRRDKIQIRVDIEILESTPVDSGTFASLAFQGITGVPYPVIPVRQIGIAAVLSGAPRIVDRLDSLLIQANELLNDENRASISQSLTNLETLTASLAGSSDTIAALPSGIDQTLADIRGVVGELKQMVETVQPDIHSAMASLDRSTANLANLTAQLDDWMTRNEANLGRFVDQGLGEAPALIAAANQTMRDLEKLLAKLQEDPSQLIYQPQQESLEIDP